MELRLIIASGTRNNFLPGLLILCVARRPFFPGFAFSFSSFLCFLLCFCWMSYPWLASWASGASSGHLWGLTSHTPPLPPALMISFEEQKFLILMKSSLSVFPFIVSACLCVPGNLSYPLNCLSVCQNLLTMCPWICMICFLSLIYVSILTNTTLFWSSLKRLEIKYCKFYSLFPRYFGN